MHRLRRLWLRGFRNYDRAELTFGPGTTALVGPNGAGKSNLLEAIHLVATGRSYRTGREAEAIRRGESGARVRAQVTRRGHDEELEVTLSAEGGRDRVQLRVNGVVTPRGGVLGRLPVVLAAPWDLDVVRGSAGGRRRLLNGALAQLSPAYHFALHRYHRVIAQRNVLLRQRAAAALEPWDAQMTMLGVRITARRREYTRRLGVQAAAWFERLMGAGTLDVTYRVSWPGSDDEEILHAARGELARCRADEFRRGLTLTGPHRDDLDLALNGAPLRACGSQGEWRVATLALRLAERAVMAEDLGAPPLLLLDDALAELDAWRQRRLLEVDVEAQVALTTTGLPGEVERGRDTLRIWTIDEGRIAERPWSHQYEPS